MCGRFTQSYTWAEVHAFLSVFGTPRNLQPQYNIAPTMTANVVRFEKNGPRELVPMRWGLIPGWWGKSSQELPATFNARAESAATRPMFRSAFKERRCIVPADAFYEWQASSGGGKQPYAIARQDGDPMTFAGLWESWRDTAGEVLQTFTIITTAANAALRPIHNRMPVILEQADWPLWLGEVDGDAAALMRPAAENVLKVWRVSRLVNNVRNDGPKLLVAASELHESPERPPHTA